MKLTPEQNDALAEFLSAQQRELGLRLAELEQYASHGFMRLAEAEQRHALSMGQTITLTEAMERASREHPEIYALYRRSVTK